MTTPDTEGAPYLGGLMHLYLNTFGGLTPEEALGYLREDDDAERDRPGAAHCDITDVVVALDELVNDGEALVYRDATGAERYRLVESVWEHAAQS